MGKPKELSDAAQAAYEASPEGKRARVEWEQAEAARKIERTLSLTPFMEYVERVLQGQVRFHQWMRSTQGQQFLQYVILEHGRPYENGSGGFLAGVAHVRKENMATLLGVREAYKTGEEGARLTVADGFIDLAEGRMKKADLTRGFFNLKNTPDSGETGTGYTMGAMTGEFGLPSDATNTHPLVRSMIESGTQGENDGLDMNYRYAISILKSMYEQSLREPKKSSEPTT